MSQPKPDRVLVGIGAAIVLLIVAALVAVLLRGQPRPLDPGTPAGVVQQYSKTVVEGDLAAAQGYLTETAKSRCTGYFGTVQAARVVLVGSTERGPTATVRVSIVHSAAEGPFGPSEYTEDGVFVLVRSGTGWSIDDLPYSLQACTGGTPVK